MPVTESKVRRGLLTIDAQDFSCQPTSVSIQPANTTGTTGNTLEVLCGDVLSEAGESGAFEANLAITAIQDFTDAQGLISLSWKNNGKTLDFTWRPTDNTADSWRGKVTVQALEVGGEVGTRLTSQATWALTELFLPSRLGGVRVIPPIDPTVQISSVTAGEPGTFQPGTAAPPADLTALKAHSVIGDTGSNAPSSDWTVGQYVVLGDASEANWDGSAWAQGRHA